MSAQFLIIDDAPRKSHEVHSVAHKLRLTGNPDVTHIQANTWQEFLPKLVDHLTGFGPGQRQGMAYSGTFLDIKFNEQSIGGIDLWEQLQLQGLSGYLGEVFVMTTSDPFSDLRIMKFINTVARGENYCDLSNSQQFMKKLCKYLDGIPNASPCSPEDRKS